MSKNTGGPAFPESGARGMAAGGEGMTLRDYLAAKAMQAVISNPGNSGSYEFIAEHSYAMADAMLKEREK